MRCVFNKVILHNFLSFGDAEVDLRNKGFCLIKGRNKNPMDRALSNGSGKSTLTSAISWALTGQTTQGTKSGIENIFTTGGCFVTLDFYVDGKHYVITRYKNHSVYKTDLKISVDGKDISGKGIMASENILSEQLPDLSFELLSSVIILGQGLPYSFTKNTPAGRKEKLETLTRSDFMIQDIKNRIYARLNKLNDRKNEIEKDNIANSTALDYCNAQIEKLNHNIEELTKSNYEQDLKDKETLKISLSLDFKEKNDRLTTIREKIENLTNLISDNDNNFRDEYKAVQDECNQSVASVSEEITKLEIEYNTLSTEIIKLDNIKDTCPTCGQKLPNVHKIDTTDKKVELENLLHTLEEKKAVKSNINDKYLDLLNDMSHIYDLYTQDNKRELAQLKNDEQALNRELTACQGELNKVDISIATLEALLEHYTKELEKLNTELKEQQDKVVLLQDKLLYNNKELDSLTESLEVVKKMDTLTKRDFRGYLLVDILSYIEHKAKEYCKHIFGSQDIEIKQVKNDICISYCGKEFELLSGGEKQKVDIIIQFAIRDMMCKYLGFTSNILFLDEITDNLDNVGCKGLMDLISTSLVDIESTFVISHHSDELVLPIDSEIIVEKNSNGISSIVH